MRDRIVIYRHLSSVTWYVCSLLLSRRNDGICWPWVNPFTKSVFLLHVSF